MAVSDKDWISTGDLALQQRRRANWNVIAAGRNLGVPRSTMKHAIDRLDAKNVARKLRGA